jgi:hypothetical protein
MQFFKELGSAVEHRWRDRDYSDEVFPAIAEEVLTENNLFGKLDPWDVIRWLHETTELPEQHDIQGAFGQPPITVFNGYRFYIDVYYWLDGTTAIHQHAFCGAFQVLQGSSILSQYDFFEKRRINPHFLTGDIRLRSVELLRGGDVRQILASQEYIHSLFHLEHPSVTLIIRTHHSPSGAPQYKYQKPYFATDPFFRSTILIKRLQSASLLHNMRHPEADALIGDLLSRSDFQSTFSILELMNHYKDSDRLEQSFGLKKGEARFQAFIEIARRRHGNLIDLLLPVFEEVQREQNLIYRRAQITGDEHRFFLALLLNVPDRAQILDLVRTRFPEQDPVETVTNWLEELCNTKAFGSPEPNVLGIEGFDDDYLFVFQCLLEGLPAEEIRPAFEREFSVEYAESLGNKPEELIERIRTSKLFGSIFGGQPVNPHPECSSNLPVDESKHVAEPASL